MSRLGRTRPVPEQIRQVVDSAATSTSSSPARCLEVEHRRFGRPAGAFRSIPLHRTSSADLSQTERLLRWRMSITVSSRRFPVSSSSHRRAAIRPVAALCLLLAGLFSVGSRPIAGETDDKPKVKASKLDRHLEKMARTPGATVRVIVRTAKGKAADVETRLARRGSFKQGDLPSIGAFAADVTGSDLGELEHDPDVLGVSTDAVVTQLRHRAEERRRRRHAGRSARGRRRALVRRQDRHRGHRLRSSAWTGSRRGPHRQVLRPEHDRRRLRLRRYGQAPTSRGRLGGTGRQSKVKKLTRDDHGTLEDPRRALLRRSRSPRPHPVLQSAR